MAFSFSRQRAVAGCTRALTSVAVATALLFSGELRAQSIAELGVPVLDSTDSPDTAARDPLPLDAPTAAVDVSLRYLNDWSVLRGASDRRAARGLLSMSALVDLERALGWSGASVSIEWLNMTGQNGSSLLQDFQGFSNIDADSFTRPGEAWIEQRVGSRMRLKGGRLDANTEFARSENNQEFINAAMGYSPTIFAMPTYPAPVPAIGVFLTPLDSVSASVGVFRGPDPRVAPDTLHVPGVFLIGETAVTWHARGPLVGRLAVGGWRHTGRFERPDSTLAGAAGLYAVIDQTVWLADPGEPDRRGLRLFVQFGTANALVAPFDRHVGGGMELTGPLPGRAADVLGIGSTWVRLRAPSGTADSETAAGGFYRLQLRPWLALKPDVQLIHLRNDGRLRAAFTCRTELGF